MYRAIITAIGTATILLSLPQTSQAQSAAALSGTEPRTVRQDFKTIPNPPVNLSQSEDIPSLDTIQLRTRLEDRVDLVRDRQGGERQQGVFPQGSPTNGDEVQVEYELQ